MFAHGATFAVGMGEGWAVGKVVVGMGEGWAVGEVVGFLCATAGFTGCASDAGVLVACFPLPRAARAGLDALAGLLAFAACAGDDRATDSVAFVL